MVTDHRFSQIQNKLKVYPKLLPYQRMQGFKLPLLLTFLHIPLGLLLYRSGNFAILHPLLTFFFGLYCAIRKHEKLERVALVIAYLIGSEVLWRMARLPIPWEFGKYGAAVIMIVAIAQRGYWKIPTPPLLYLLLLIPSCLLTLMTNSLNQARETLSHNMSGPLLLFISCWFFSYLRVTPTQLKKLFLTTAIPIISIAVTTLFYTITIENIEFTNESNFMTSGGFGPNQVSTILGMGVFICLACYLLFKNNLKVTIYLSILVVLFATQSVMTFSRSGIYNAIGATLVIVFFQMQNLTQGVKKILPVIGLGLIFLVLIYPQLDNFTGGKLQERFEDTGTTNRAEIIEADFQLFLENPILGTGVGEAKSLRKEYLGFKTASHTEFTRIISEHGILGVFSIIALGLGTFYNFRRQTSNLGKAFVVGVVLWSMLFMFNTGMRLGAPSFMLGLSFLTIVMPSIRKRRFMKTLSPKNLCKIVNDNSARNKYGRNISDLETS